MKRLFEKLFCCHSWQKIHITNYTDRDIILLQCTKCGRLTKRTV